MIAARVIRIICAVTASVRVNAGSMVRVRRSLNSMPGKMLLSDGKTGFSTARNRIRI